MLSVIYIIFKHPTYSIIAIISSVLPASVAQLDARSTDDRRLRVRPPPGRQHSFVEI